MHSDHFYLTTTLPYVNAEPHIGFALEIVAADVICRFQEQQGKKVIFNTGTDEHGQKIYQQALAANQDPQQYCDAYAAKFADLQKLLNLSFNHFIRTTDAHHVAAAQVFWQKCFDQGDIYKKTYQTKYCVGCELEKTDSELVDNRCPLHATKEIEYRDEENYFFRFSAYAEKLLAHYQSHPEFVKPAHRLKEIQSFVAQGLQDFSISRLKAKMSWGIPVPNDSEHVMYVWFDALINYISTLGWPEIEGEYTTFWPGVQVAGKDNLRQQSAMWQAMLLSAGLSPSKQILINGFIGVNSQKMSKSLGNVISPTELVTRYGLDASRFLLINLGPFGEDMDVSWTRFDQEYTAMLANGYGNLTSRILKMAERAGLSFATNATKSPEWYQQFCRFMEAFELSSAVSLIKEQINSVDQYLSDQKPWKLSGGEQTSILQVSLEKLYWLNQSLQSLMPQTTQTVSDALLTTPIIAPASLFPRLAL